MVQRARHSPPHTSAPSFKPVKNLSPCKGRKHQQLFKAILNKDLAERVAAQKECLWQSYKLMNKLKGFTRVIQSQSKPTEQQRMILPEYEEIISAALLEEALVSFLAPPI